MAVYLYLRNRKHFPCFHTVIETRVEVWENEKLKYGISTLFWVLPNFHECFYNVLEHGKKPIYKITCRKLKHGNSPSLSKRKFSILFMMAYNGVNLSMFSIQLQKHGFQPIKAHVFKMLFYKDQSQRNSTEENRCTIFRSL